VLEDRMHVLVNDGGAIDMLKLANRYDEIHLFLVNNVLEFLLYLLIMFFMSLRLHLAYYPLVVSIFPLIVLFLLPNIMFPYRTRVRDGGLTPDVSLIDFINYKSLHMLAQLWILHLSSMLGWVILVLSRCNSLF